MDVLKKVRGTLSARYAQPVTVSLFSSLKRSGIEEAHQVLDGWFEVEVKVKAP